MTERTLDVICLGRVAVDFYGEQIGSRLEDMTSFAKYLGGSSGNMATGTSRLGLRSAMLARVGDEHMGRFVRETLQHEGVDVSHVITDAERLTALVVLGIKDRETFPLIFYRNHCADMGITEDDIDEDFIASSKTLAITGTHFSTPSTDAACRKAIEYAKKHGTRVAVDIDYRPVLWGLTGHGLGEERFVASEKVSEHLQTIVPLCDLIVGTEEEIHIAGGSTDTVAALRRIRELSSATIVCKRGPLGASVFEGAIPDTLDEGITVKGVRVEVLNVLGAGDAFMSGLLRGWVNEEPWEQALRYANASGALVVSRHGCTPSMPSKVELDDYLSRAESVPRPDLDARLNYLHRATNRRRDWPELMVMAFDHRKQLEEMAVDYGVDLGRVTQLKQLIMQGGYRAAREAGIQGKAGILADSRYGQAVLEELTGQGWWIGRPVELPSSRPLEFETGNNIAGVLRSWPEEHVVKCLVFYHPDDAAALKAAQEKKVLELFEACCMSGHELLLEIIPPAGSEVDPRTLSRAMARFYELGVYPDWWKLPSPSREAWPNIAAQIEANDPHCRGVVLLGLDAPEEVLQSGFQAAADQPWCKGFMVGRTIFGAPSRAWFAGELDDQGLIEAITGNYLRMIALWRQARGA